MARDFASASSQYLEGSASPIAATGFTMACWIYPYQANLSVVAFSIGDSAGVARALVYPTNVAVISATAVNDAGTTAAANTTATYTANTWHHICGIFQNANRYAFLNGVKSAINSTTITFSTNINRLRVGCQNTTGGALATFFNGRVAEAAIWNIVLADGEISRLAQGINPRTMRPANLAGYWPLYGEGTTEVPYKGGIALSVNAGSAKAYHPRIYGVQ
jgi:hypothetical protein